MNDTAPVHKQDVEAAFGSDALAQILRELHIPYIALTPGASFRGLHDSLVNFLGNTRPELLLCIHEENAVSLAHGYARVTNKPLAVALHANVGLMHATMAIFNAWCDRIPIVMVGGVGPLDAVKRRPWVDWIHTSRDLGAIIRDYTKWDDLPGSVAAALESIVRAHRIAMTYPRGPTYRGARCRHAGGDARLARAHAAARPVSVAAASVAFAAGASRFASPCCEVRSGRSS